ncbi:MAG: hypothetical protein OXD01_03425 [Gammaproteobacteria bacterium]|nr:hypothetical protein [Gammaproteobacteria bacterium]
MDEVNTLVASMKQDEREVPEEDKTKGLHVFSNGQMGVFLSIAAILISVNLWGFSSINTRIDDSVVSINTRIDDVNTRIDDVNTRIDDLSMEVRTLRGEVVDVSIRVARIEGHLGLTTELAIAEYTDPEDALTNPSAPLATTGN